MSSIKWQSKFINVSIFATGGIIRGHAHQNNE